jgi:hypothetical protein
MSTSICQVRDNQIHSPAFVRMISADVDARSAIHCGFLIQEAVVRLKNVLLQNESRLGCYISLIICARFPGYLQ